MYFNYGKKETEYLKSKDSKLAFAIEEIGHIHREMDDDLFTSVIHHIIGQQISSSAQATIWQKLHALVGTIDVETIVSLK